MGTIELSDVKEVRQEVIRYLVRDLHIMVISAVTATKIEIVMINQA
jgi:hypothetical protein